jgi:hypothetical protein
MFHLLHRGDHGLPAGLGFLRYLINATSVLIKHAGDSRFDMFRPDITKSGQIGDVQQGVAHKRIRHKKRMMTAIDRLSKKAKEGID